MLRQERWEVPGAEYVALPAAKPGAGGATAVHVTASADAPAAAKEAAADDEDTNEHRIKRFTPFSVGPRDCIGQNLAKINYQTTVPMLLSHFSFKLSNEVSFGVSPCIPLQPHWACLLTGGRSARTGKNEKNIRGSG